MTKSIFILKFAFSKLLKPTKSIPFAALIAVLSIIESNPSRLAKIEALSNFFVTLIQSTPQLVVKCIYLMLNQVAPSYENIEFGIGEGVMQKCLSQITGNTHIGNFKIVG